MHDELANRLRRRLQGYSGGRPDILRLVTSPPQRVLDIGCGAGLLGRQLHERFPFCTTVGVEPNLERAAIAGTHHNQVICGDVEDPSIMSRLAVLAPFDLIICADVLEHMVAPEKVLAALAGMLTAGGRLITSVPNVRHLSTLVDLYLLGRWPQRDRGIHDRTHLHYYAKPNILALGRSAGLRPVREARNLRLFEAHPWSMVPARLLDFWPLRGLYTFQYLHVWERRG
ncbi:methyltransferase domain-containing protein [Pseudoxanthomonas sp. J31]|uniref:class I SAM-dependent methyltransferase n=1 Tax=Pseudoxanthomonas sp. J31 TaxID=935851 RepID=UPI00048C95AF|nr:methyltransferase domain-containing protein [Pseudoxanthomonas sp. J31]